MKPYQTVKLYWSFSISREFIPGYWRAKKRANRKRQRSFEHPSSQARFVAYWHRAFGSPSLSTFHRALKHGFIRGIPHLTHHLVAKYPPLSLSTSFGHLDMLRKGISSSRPKIPPSCLGPVAPTPETRRASPHLAALHDWFPPDSSRVRTVHRSEWFGADLTS